MEYFAIGNNELSGKKPISSITECPNCRKKHRVKYGTDTKTGEISKLLGFVNCGEEQFLVSVAGKKLGL